MESVQKQVFSDYEHIIIDNSPKRIETLITHNQQNYKRLIYISNKYNLGIADSRNQGLKLATGKYICFLDHDDVFLSKNHLKKLSDFLETHPDYGIIASLIISINEQGKELHKNLGRISDTEIRNHSLQACQFTPCSMMIRKEAILEH
ncbi:MAG: glycosyltransferase family 2 protein [Candidatus Peribacteria bacterium]|nr:glycosyltransferase family 2 protein [Candidatus Peribacteria bacterium]